MNEPWMTDANCLDVNIDDFFPKTGDVAAAARAKAICNDCPVRLECYEYAERVEQQWGIFGGFTVRERRLLRGRRAA